MESLQRVKDISRRFTREFHQAELGKLESVLAKHTTEDYHWRGMHPFYEQFGAADVVASFWQPLNISFTSLQRREDIFFAGLNDCDNGESAWTLTMGNYIGLFDQEWLGIKPTGRMCFLRFVEFHCVTADNKIRESAFFCDIVGVMHQALQYPLPPMTGTFFMYPGPIGHDGILVEATDPSEGIKTMALLNKMIDDLNELNVSGSYGCPPEVLARTWSENMAWYGPCGIGASYTIERYQKQHQLPFRENLSNKVFNGHVARFSEGNYAGFFGWPNLNNQNRGGFLGLPASQINAPMRVVDVYRREGDKLVENWVFIDILHYLYEQGLDVLERNRQLNI